MGILSEGTGKGAPREPAWAGGLSGSICVVGAPLTAQLSPVPVTRPALGRPREVTAAGLSAGF